MDLIRAYPIVSDQVDAKELEIILLELEKVLKQEVKGDVVEFGCFAGTTSLFLQRLLLQYGGNKKLHVYDSFAGLPPKTSEDQSPAGEQFKQGELIATKSQLIKHFKQAGLPLPTIHKGWFEEFTPDDVPSQISFAFLDGDFYSSILASLRLVWPRLSPGATIIVDDYHTEALPGVRRAIEEWQRTHPCTIRTQASLAIIYR
ncbi:MAG: TylF/MycF/NovP-related O-methyltransferase [Candidatus Saccharimonadales bacterium]